MADFHGEFECTMDAKGRIMLPAGLKKQLPKATKNKILIKRGFEKCLELYPKNEWDIVSASVNKLNDFVKNNRLFKRAFFHGATELTMDSVARILIPKQQQDYAGLKNDLVLFAYGNKIEIWAKKEYELAHKINEDDFSALAEEVMGKAKSGDTK